MFKRSISTGNSPRHRRGRKDAAIDNVEGRPSLGGNVVGRAGMALVQGVTDVATNTTKATLRTTKKVTKAVVTDPLSHLATNTKNVRRKIFPRVTRHFNKIVSPRFHGKASGDQLEPDALAENLSSLSIGGPIEDQEEINYLLDELSDNFLFKELPYTQLENVVKAFERITVQPEERVIQQGEPGDYFYVLYKGRVTFLIGDEPVGQTQGGSFVDQDPNDDEADYGTIVDGDEAQKRCFGELALLTAGPRAASVMAETKCVLFRLDQSNFRRILQGQGQELDQQRVQLLKSLPVLQDLDTVALNKLVSAMTDLEYPKGTIIFDHGQSMEDFFIVCTGVVEATDIKWGNATYENVRIGPNEPQRSFGWRAMTESDAKMVAKVVALTDVTLLAIEAATFKRVLGKHTDLMRRLQYKRQLKSVAVFRDSQLNDIELNALLDFMKHEHFTHKTHLIREGTKVDASISFVRKGKVTLSSKEDNYEKVLEEGAYFGQEWMLIEQNKEIRNDKPAIVKSKMTVVVEPGTDIDYIMLEDARKVVDTTMLGLGKPVVVSGIDPSIRIQNVIRHRMLGAGSFGQVWLATLKGDQTNKIYALKVQSKLQLLETGQADGVIAEINIMKCLRSDFLIRLYGTFQDSQRVYMLTSLMQGGELESIMSDRRLEDDVAQFYAAGILEGLTYMHRRHIIHRDLKPENVLIDSKGYPVLIDLGFAKYVPDKTYTFCGTPMYIAPEVIQYKGHDKGVDHWAWACMIFEMVTAKYPFYEGGMAELDLFKKICRGQFKIYGFMSFAAKLLFISLLEPDPSKRLGASPNGWKDLMQLPFFADFDFEGLRKRKIVAPWVPKLKNPLDASNFPKVNHVLDKMNEEHVELSEAQQKIFNCFGPMTGHGAVSKREVV